MSELVEPQPIILVEGILIFAEPELRKLFDVRIFVDTARGHPVYPAAPDAILPNAGVLSSQ